jgi:hypothetical protein
VETVDLSDSVAAGSFALGDMWDLDGHSKRAHPSTPTPASTPTIHSNYPRRRPPMTAFSPSANPMPTHGIGIEEPASAAIMPMQYAPAMNHVSTGLNPFGRPQQNHSVASTFNSFPLGQAPSGPQDTTMHSPEKTSIISFS